MAVTEEIAGFTVQMKFSDIPADVVNLARQGILDWIGVALGGSAEAAPQIVVQFVRESGGNPEATVVAHDFKTSVGQAALVNGIMSHVLDYDDTHEDSLMHPTVAVLPGALALAEKHHLSGQDLITAYVTGYEVATHLARAVFPSHYDRGWHATATLGTFGAAAAAGKLLGLTREQLVYCLGIAGTQASGLREVFGTMCKSFHAGKAAMQGVMAALLAQRGFTSCTNIIEGPRGFARVMSLEEDKVGEVTRGLGEEFLLRENIFKAHACCLLTHPAVDAVMELQHKYNLRPDEVEEITAYVYRLAPDAAGIPEPASGLEGKFSLPYCLAVALSKGNARQSQFSDVLVQDPEIAALRRKVKVVVEPGYRATQGRVVVKKTSGEELEAEVQSPKGSPANPMTYAEAVEKFDDLARPILGTRTERVMEYVEKIERQEDVASLMQLLGKEG